MSNYLFSIYYKLDKNDLFRYNYEDKSYDLWLDKFVNDCEKVFDSLGTCIIDGLKFDASYIIEHSDEIRIDFTLTNSEIFTENTYTKEDLQNIYDDIISYLNDNNTEFVKTINEKLKQVEIAYIPTSDFIYSFGDYFFVLVSHKYPDTNTKFECIQIADNYEDNESVSNLLWELNNDFHIIEGEFIAEE